MGRAAADKKSQRTSDKRGRGKDSGKTGKDEKSTFVPKYEYFAKSKLASYPNEDGVCLHLGKGQDERSFFALKNICQTRTGKNEELCRRLGMGIALDAASAQHGAQLLQKRFPGEMPEDLKKQLAKTGVPKLLDAFSSEGGKGFLTALEVLNVGKTGQPAEKTVKKAMKVFVDFLNEDDGTLVRNLARLASDAAGLYLFSMNLLKDMALLTDPEAWAGKVEGKQKDAVKAWLKKPKNTEKMLTAIVSEFMDKVNSNEPAAGRKRKASDSSSAVAAASASGSGSGSDGSAKAASSEASSSAASPARSGSASKSSKSSSPAPTKKKAKKDDKQDTKKEKDNKKDKKETEKDKKKDKDAKKTDKEKKQSKEDAAKTKKEKKEKPDKKESQEAKKAAEQAAEQAAREAKTAAFTAWKQGDAQAMLDQAEEAKGSIGLMSGRFKTEEIMALAKALPLEVVPHFPEVEKELAKVVELDSEWVPNTQAKPLLAMLVDLAQEVVQFWADQAEPAGSATK